MLVACSGAKSLLDVPATMELPRDARRPGARLPARTRCRSSTRRPAGRPSRSGSTTSETAARVAAAHWQLGGCGLLLANPPPESIEVEDLIEEAVAEAARQGVSGQAVTPFVLAFLHERSDGRTREVNRKLIVANARLAGEVSVAFAAL